MSKSYVVPVAVISVNKVNIAQVAENLKNGMYKQNPSFLTKNTSTKSLTDAGKKNNISIFTDKLRIHVDITGTRHRSAAINVHTTEGGDCFYCRRPYETKGLGYAVAIDRVKTEEGIEKYYYVDDARICGPRCVYAWLQMLNISNSDRRKYLECTQEMFTDLYGEKEIKPAADFRLLKRNGGTETDEEWERYFYLSIGTVNTYARECEFIRRGA